MNIMNIEVRGNRQYFLRDLRHEDCRDEIAQHERKDDSYHGNQERREAHAPHVLHA